MSPSPHRTVRLLVIVGAVAAPPVAAATVADGPRNPAGEAASGDTKAMLSVVQETVDCLRVRGFHPGDPEVQGQNVVIAGWNPAWGSAAGRATEECSFPVRAGTTRAVERNRTAARGVQHRH